MRKFFLICIAISVSAEKSWWKNAVIYQVYPRSFMDSDGDGIGDLNGLTSRLGHLKDLQVNAVWLSPIYKSPQRDFGYDISDYVDIDPDYGTLEDFDRFVDKAHELGLKVIMDFVPNHSSSDHEWFQKSLNGTKPYDDYYIWRDPGPSGPPNNWLSVFGGSAWTFRPERGQYYFHQFLEGQPDLNFRNPNVHREMEKIIRFWLDRGVNGFRMDAISHMFEDTLFRDEPRSHNNVPSNDYGFLDHVYTTDLNETYQVLKNWRNLLNLISEERQSDHNLILTEAYVGFPILEYLYHSGSDVPFNFRLITDLNRYSRAADYKRVVQYWYQNMPPECTANWVTGNHDQSRVASRYGFKRENQALALAVILPGVAVIYNGDEIGMVNRPMTFEETQDPSGCNAGPDRYEFKSRDPERTPFQWDNTKNSGFSSANKTWIPVHENYKVLNLQVQKVSGTSHYKVSKDLVALRKTRVLMEGSFEVSEVSSEIFGVVRRLPGHEPVILLINTGESDVLVNFTEKCDCQKYMRVYTASVRSGISKGELVDTSEMVLPGAATVVLGDGHEL